MPRYYSTLRFNDEQALAHLHHVFPTGEPDELNFCLFSTGGVHGSYQTIEDAWEARTANGALVTYLLIQPRTVTTTYGNVRMRTEDDVLFLKRLRDRSRKLLASE